MDPRKERVVVIAHSQGTIIMAYVLRLLKGLWPKTDGIHGKKSRIVAVEPESPYTPAKPVFVYPNQAPLKPSDFSDGIHVPAEQARLLSKLEIYCFANCARQMTYLPMHPGIPWI